MVKLENRRPGGFGLPGGQFIAGEGSIELDQAEWDKAKDHPVVKAWVEADHLVVSGDDADDDAGGNERDELKKHAKELNIEFARNVTTEKLKELVDAKLAA